MKREKKYGTDIIPEDVQTSVHNISFTFIAIVIGVIVFWLSQVLFAVKEGVVTFDDAISISQTEETDTKPVEITPEKDLGHNYCGTFFIWQTVGNNYKSVENYNDYLEYQEKGTIKTARTIGLINSTFPPIIAFVCLLISFRRADKRRFFEKNGWRSLMTAGIVYLISSLWKVYEKSLDCSVERKFGTGIFANTSYYCQVYHYFGLPALILLTALIMRQHSLNTHNQSTAGNEKALRITAGLTGAVGFGFMLLRLGTRIYEIIFSGSHDARLPFYSMMLDFPRELAESPETYRNVLIFRLVKDMPVFIASAVTVVMLIKIMLSAAQNKINTAENIRRFNISMAALAVSSLIYNLLGLHEVKMISGHFSGIYEQVTYTIGIRSLCDPVIYIIILWFVKTFIRMVKAS